MQHDPSRRQLTAMLDKMDEMDERGGIQSASVGSGPGSALPHRAAPVRAEHESPVLALLEPARRPDPMPVCGSCPNSLWSSAGQKTQCFCRMMHVVTWDSDDPQPITACDGVLIEEL